MKLHLPIGLRIALLTVIASLSFAAGDVTITHDGQPVSQEEYPEGIIQKGTPMEGDIEITVSDNEQNPLIIEDDLAQKGDATITVGKGGQIVLRELGSIGAVSIDGDFKTEITVLEGGEFHQTGASAVGGGAPWNGKHVREITTETVVTVDGGLYEMKSTGQVCDEKGFPYTRCTLGGSDILYSDENIVDTTTIQVKKGGKFQMIAAQGSLSTCLIGYAAWKGSQVVLDMTVEGEGSLFQLRSEAGANAYLAYAAAGTVKDTIHILNKGKFELSQADGEEETYINYARAGEEGPASSYCEIKLENGGTMEVQSTSLYDRAGIGIAQAAISSSSPGAIATAVTKLTVVGKDSSFRMQSGAIGWAEARNKGSIATSQTSILVQDGGSFTINETDLGTTYYSQNGGGNGKMVAQTDITVEGSGSSFTLEGGASIGRIASKADPFTAVNTTTILVKDGGLFKMNGGMLGYSQSDVRKLTVEAGTVAIELRGEGSVMEILSPADKTNHLRGEVTIDVYDQSRLVWNDSKVNLSSSGKDPIITMHGGALGGDTQVPSGVKVKIDVDKSFSGDLDMGGLNAQRIQSGFKIDGAGAVIRNLSGTLSISGTDNQIRVGSRSVRLSGEGDAGDAKALIDLNDGGKVSFSRGSRLTLLFGGDVIKDLADQKGKEEVSLEIWFTDGTVSYGTSESAKTVFLVGAGWGLDVEAVDITAEGGKITLSGSTKDVWFSSEADKGGGHYGENLSVVSDKSKIVIDESATLNADQNGTLNLLEGTEDLAITGNAEVVLDHTGTPFHSSDTEFRGNINVTGGASLKKTGEGSLTVDGNLTADGDVTVAQGTLTLGDGENSIGGALTVGDAESDTSGKLDVQGNLKANGAVNVAAGELVLKSADNTVAGELSMAAEGTLQVAKDGQLTLSGDSNLTAGTLTGEGTITVAEESGSLTVGEGVTLGKDLSLRVKGNLTLHGERGTEEGEGAITGSGTLTVDKEGQLSTGSHLNVGISTVEVKGTLSQGGGQIVANDIVVEEDGTYELKDGTIGALPQGDAPGTLSLQVAGAFEMSGGEITDGTFTLSDTATLTQSNGTIKGGSITLNGSATMKQTGGKVTGGTFTLSDTATLTQSDAGTINGGSITLNGSATLTQTGGQITGSTLELSDTATLTQSKGTINGGSITLSGNATMKQDGGEITGGTLELSDNASLTQSKGTINGGSITLSGSATMKQTGGDVTGGVSVTLSGEGTSYTQEGGSIGKDATFSLSGGATLTLSGGSMNGAVTMEGEASLYDLGNQTAQGSIIMHGGSLENAGSYAGTLAIQTSDKYTGALDLGGVDATCIKSIRLAGKDTYLTGLKSGTTLTLNGQKEEDGYDNSIMVGISSAWVVTDTTTDITVIPDGKRALIEFQDGEGTINFTEGSKFSLDFSGKLVDKLVEGHAGVSFQVYFTNGELTFGSEGVKSGDVKDYFALGAGWGLQVEEYTVTPDGGVLTITGDMSNVAVLNGGEPKMNELKDKEAVIVTGDTTLASTEGGTLRHLTGEGDLTITGSGEVNLENEKDEFDLGDSKLTGKLTTDPDINLHKTGSENLTLSGGLEAKGDLTVDKGGLVLGEGSESSIGGSLTLGEDGHLQVDGQLTLSGSGDLSAGKDGLSGKGKIVVNDGGSLKLNSDMLGAPGLPAIDAKAGSTLEFADTDPVDFDLVKDMACTVAGDFTSTGDATFAGSVEGKLTVKGGSLNMSNTENGLCDLYVVGKDTQATITPGSEYNSITVGDDVQDNDKLIVTAAAEGNKAGADIRVTGDIVFRNGAEADFTINLSDPNLWGSDMHDATMLSTTKTIYIEPGAKFVVDCLADTLLNARGNLSHVILLQGDKIENTEYHGDEEAMISGIMLTSLEPTSETGAELDANCDLGVILSQLYEDPQLFTDGEKVWFDATHRSASPWTPVATSRNSGAGLNLLWQHINTAGAAIDPQVENMFTVLDNLVAVNPTEARRVMAAVAGSTLTSVSAAQSAALRNQMGRVHDHALQAARLRCAGNADEATAQQRPCKNSHVWVEGTSFFSEQHSVGDESGYRLNSWGGAVGIDAQVDAHWSVGVSLSASYGDLEARAADYAKGDLDTYTVSFWSQAKNGRWGNTLLFTLGTNEADLKRTVNYGAGSYTATSNTSGSSLGAMWEVTYDLHPVKDNKSNILQPLFNVVVMHTSMDGFSEGNAGNVGLTTEKQTRDTVTLGLGLRWLAAINSAKAINRTVTTELHANVAQDMGDRRSVANMALLADPNFTQNVYGSKAGSTAFQFGAGVNVPMTPNSQIYVNAGGELREHANAWNAALGVRMGF